MSGWLETLQALPPAPLLRVQAGVTCMLAGLAWTVQAVHYPLFARVGREAWPAYHAAHVARITPLVAPLMVLELALAGWVLWAGALPAAAAWAGLGMAGAIWLSTALLQVPLHDRLAQGLDEALVRRLVATSWLRTLLWTARAGLCLAAA
jgi:hypothetical protein